MRRSFHPPRNSVPFPQRSFSSSAESRSFNTAVRALVLTCQPADRQRPLRPHRAPHRGVFVAVCSLAWAALLCIVSVRRPPLIAFSRVFFGNSQFFPTLRQQALAAAAVAASRAAVRNAHANAKAEAKLNLDRLCERHVRASFCVCTTMHSRARSDDGSPTSLRMLQFPRAAAMILCSFRRRR